MIIRQAYSATLALFLAVQRDLLGRYSWESNLLPRPVLPDIAQFADGFAAWAPVTRTNVPAQVAAAARPEDLPDLVDDHRLAAGTGRITAALAAAAPTLLPRLAADSAALGLNPGPDPGPDHRFGPPARELADVLVPDRYLPAMREALGSAPARGVPDTLDLYLVPYAPHTPAAGFLSAHGRIEGMYVDANRLRGGTLADSVLTLLGWAHLMTGGAAPAEAATHLSVELATRLPGSSPYQRRMRLLLTKILVEMLAGHLVRTVRPDHRPCTEVLGTRWRFPRLFGVAERHWSRYLSGDLDRVDALDAMAADLAAHSPRWFVDPVDPASLAADFYLLEWLAADGDRDAAGRLARWLPQLCADLAGHLDVVVGNELGHFGRADLALYPPSLAEFLKAVNDGDSRAAWPRIRAALGSPRALRLATEAFAGPGVEFGGEAWRPIAAMMYRYVTHELPDRVFVDQCFTLEHNNGSVFDKFYDIEAMPVVLDAQARTDLDTLVRHASAEVRGLWHRHHGRTATTNAAVADWFGLSVREARPGTLGCGNRAEPDEFDPACDPLAAQPVRIRHMEARRPLPATLTRYRTARISLHTTLGDVRLDLWPADAPYTVDNFIGLATGTRPWRDPATGEWGRGGFYDGTVFHRRVPGFLVQGGDRLGTGAGGAGYRILEEVRPGPTFDQPFRVGMVNLSTPGSHSTSSQFFITVAATPHLEGVYAGFGAVHADSHDVVLAIAGATGPVSIRRVSAEVEVSRA